MHRKPDYTSVKIAMYGPSRYLSIIPFVLTSHSTDSKKRFYENIRPILIRLVEISTVPIVKQNKHHQQCLKGKTIRTSSATNTKFEREEVNDCHQCNRIQVPVNVKEKNTSRIE